MTLSLQKEEQYTYFVYGKISFLRSTGQREAHDHQNWRAAKGDNLNYFM